MITYTARGVAALAVSHLVEHSAIKKSPRWAPLARLDWGNCWDRFIEGDGDIDALRVDLSIERAGGWTIAEDVVLDLLVALTTADREIRISNLRLLEPAVRAAAVRAIAIKVEAYGDDLAGLVWPAYRSIDDDPVDVQLTPTGLDAIDPNPRRLALVGEHS